MKILLMTFNAQQQNESKSILFEIEANIKEKIFQLFWTRIPYKPVYQLGGLGRPSKTT